MIIEIKLKAKEIINILKQGVLKYEFNKDLYVITVEDYKIIDDEKKRELMIKELIEVDISMIIEAMKHGDTEYIYHVLRGDGFTPYDMLTDEQLITEYEEQFGEEASTYRRYYNGKQNSR